MRSFKVMRYGRRQVSTNNELTRSMSNSFSSTSLSQHRNSTSLSPNEQYQDVQPSNDDDTLFRHRRHTLLSNVDLSSRRLSFQQDLIELPKPQTHLRNFYIFFILLFLFLFICLIYSFIRMINNPN